MAKKKEPKLEHAPTKKQLSHWQKQARRQRLIGIIGAVTIVAALAVMISGWYFKQYVPVDKPMRETVLEVNGQKFSMAYYIDAIDYMLGDYASDYVSYYLDYVENSIEQIALIKAESAAMGVTVTEADIDQYIKENAIGSDNQATRDIIQGQLLIQRLQSDYFEPQVPASGEYREVLAMFLESQSQLEDIKAQIDAGADFGELAAEYSLENTTQSGEGSLGSHPNGIFDYLTGTTGFDDAIFSQPIGTWGTFADSETSKQVGYWLVKVTERNEDNTEVSVSAMLLSSMEEAQSVKSRLDAGEDFDTLAEEFSQIWSETDGADLGAIASTTTAAYKSYIFDETTAIGAVSDPIKDTASATDGGYWLFKVLNSEVKDISSDDKDDFINKAYNKWIADLQESNADNIHNSLDDAKKLFATNYFKS